MRFTCSIEGMESNWIEFSDAWTRREGKDLYGLPERDAFDKYMALKCTACHIEDTAGQVFTDPQKLKYADLDDLDARVFGFVARSLFLAYSEQQNLGNASARLSSNGVVPTMMTAPPSRIH